MDPNATFDKGPADAPPLGEGPREWPGVAKSGPAEDVRFPAEDGGRSLAQMAERDLDATLQLLAERAQYITGATGAAIALRDGDQMVCKASSGSSAPEVGAQLQTDSGLSGESIRTKQTLRCDDTQTDRRVNRESCEALGIASVVVMPMIEGEEVVGVFELFSDHPHAFEERDITALDRMGFMVRTAIAQADAARVGAQKPEDGAGQEDGVTSSEIKAIALVESQNENVNSDPAAVSSPAGPESEAHAAAPSGSVTEAQTGKPEDALVVEIRRELFAAEKTAQAEAPADLRPSKIAFHIRGPLPRHGAPAADVKPNASEPAPEPVVAKAKSAEPPAEVAQPETATPGPSLSENAPESDAVTENGHAAVSEPPVKSEAAAVSAAGAATAPAPASAKEPVQEKPAREGDVVPAAKATEAASGETEPITLSFGTAVVPDISNERVEEVKAPATTAPEPPTSKVTTPRVTGTEPKVEVAGAGTPIKTEADPAAAPDGRARNAVAGLKRCEACGFPVSEGRKLCLDCEKKKPGERPSAGKVEPQTPSAAAIPPVELRAEEAARHETVPEGKAAAVEQTPSPQFLVTSPDQYESWIVSHMYAVVAMAVVVLGAIVYLLSR
jgi:putative methionine-R-sulfoxide reductase with GAF domain